MREVKTEIKGRILYAEDNQLVRKFSTGFMRDWGYEVLDCADGEEAYNTFLAEVKAGRTIDLVVSDIQMPRMSGAQLIGKLRQECEFTGSIGILSGTEVSEFFIRDNDIIYVGLDVEECLRKHEKRIRF